jgi:hypothetical protein
MNPLIRKSRLLLHPVFLLALLILVTNDLYLKWTFHNALTGKLSDFAGLFAFSVFGLALFPQHRRWIPWMAGGLFILWKTPLSTPLIEAWNACGILPFHRVVDPGDLLALLVLPLAGRLRMSGKLSAPPLPALQMGILALSLFAFVASSYRSEFEYDEVYEFDFSCEEMVRRLNQLNLTDSLGNLPLSPHHAQANDFESVSGERYYYHHSGELVVRYDTIEVEYLDEESGNESLGTEIEEYMITERDTHYVNPDGRFQYRFPLPATISGDERYCESLPADLLLTGDGNQCQLQLVRVMVRNCEPMFEHTGEKGEVEFVKENFEEGLVKRLRKMR